MTWKIVRIWNVWGLFALPFIVHPDMATLAVALITALLAVLATGITVAVAAPATLAALTTQEMMALQVDDDRLHAARTLQLPHTPNFYDGEQPFYPPTSMPPYYEGRPYYED